MATINRFRVSNDLSTLELTISTTVGNTITSLVLWTHENFKDPDRSRDLSSFLTGSSNIETITLTAAQVGETMLESIYFIEAVSSDAPDTPQLGIAVDFTRFQICITEILCRVAVQTIYNDNEIHKAITYNMYIESLRNTILEGRYRLSIGFFNNLNRVCQSECKACCDLTEIAKKGLGFSILNNELILY